MEQFAYSFLITMLHSIWQMALLLLVYFIATNILSKWQPLAKRNLLLVMLATQLLLSIISFYFIYTTPFFDYRYAILQLLQSFGSSQTFIQQYSSWIFAAYTFVLAYKIAAIFAGWLRFKKMHSEAGFIKASAEIRNFTLQSSYRFGIKQKVQIWYSHQVKSPIVFGFFKPIILLPVAMVNSLSVCQTEALIIHELTHIKYKDYLYNWMLISMEAVYFFNPFVKIAIGFIKIEREKNCDVQVLQFNYSSIGYAEALLLIAKNQLQPIRVPVAAVNKSNELLNRIRFFSATENFKNQHNGKAIPFIAAILFAILSVNIFFAGLSITKPGISKSTTIKLKANYIANLSELKEWNKPVYNNTFAEIASSVDDAAVSEKEVAMVEKNIAAIKASNARAKQSVLLQKQSEEEFNEPPFDTNPLASTISFAATEPVNSKEFVITEQNSNGTSTTRIIRVTQTQNGEWKTEPIMMVTEQILNDSLRNIIQKDSNIIHLLPAVQ